MNGNRYLVSCLFVSSLTVFGCAHQPEARRSTAAVDRARTASAEVASGSSATGGGSDATCRADVDCARDRICVDGRCVPVSEAVSACVGVEIHFQYNSALIDEAARSGLERTARCLEADHALQILIAGNTDERGTVEYNMALGEHRARAVAKYLEALGVKEAQLRSVSYGEERPLCSAEDESCWSRNRRADLRANHARR